MDGFASPGKHLSWDAWMSRSGTTLLALTGGSGLFQVPEGYREMSPSQLQSALFDLYPNVPRTAAEPSAVMDAQYNVARQQAGLNN